MWYEFPSDPHTFSLDDQFMVGPSILVKPVTDPSLSSLDVYLPSGSSWYGPSSFTRIPGGQTITVNVTLDAIPTFFRAGSIIVRRDRVRRSSSIMQKDPYTLMVFLDEKYSARGELYYDDGATYGYREGGGGG